MKLLTTDLEKKFAAHPFGSQSLGEDSIVLAKYFNPYGRGTWLITEAEKQDDGDWLLFGYCNIFEWEWGYVSLRELENIRPFRGLPIGIERDIYIDNNMTVKELAD